MNRQPIIACDIDGVVADLHTSWLQAYNNDYGDNLKSEDVNKWELHEFVKPLCGYNIYKYLNDPSLYDNTEPVEGALTGVEALRSEGFRVVFVTSTNLHASGRKLKWLEKHGFLTLKHGVQSPDYVEMVDKSLIRADVMIDDYPVNLEGFNGLEVLFSQPWNRTCQKFPRVAKWRDVPGLMLYTAELYGLFRERVTSGTE